MVQPGPSPRPSTIRVLHVDDEQSQLKFTKSFVNLSDSTIHMESVATPEAALRRLKEENFDCIVSDYQMPILNGIELARRIRGFSDIPIIIYTGRGSEEVAETAFTVGIDDYIRKEITPSHYQVLARRIRSAVDKKRAEDKVIQERDLAQKYLDVAGVMLVILDTEGRVMLLNQKGCEILGVSQEEALGKNWFDSFLLSPNVEEVKGVVRELMAGNIEPVRFYENPVVSSSGEERIIAWHNSLLHDDEGNITGILSSGSDITEQRRTEEKFRALLDESRDAILVLDNERYLYGNSKAAELLGFSDPSELIGRDAFEFVAPEDREKVREIAFRRQKGEVVPSRYEFNLFNREGKRVPVEVNVSLIEYDGKPASLSINRDITERRRAEEAMKASEAKYRSFLEEGLDGVVVTRNGNYLYINQRYAEMLGYSDPSELLGRNTREVIDPRDAERLDAIREQRQRGDMQRFIYEVRSRKKDGSSIWVGVASSGIEFEGNQAVITYAQDITERKRLEEDTKQYQKRLEALHSSSFRLSKHDHLNGMFMETLDIIKDVLGFQYLGIAQIKGDEITFDVAVEAYYPGDFKIPLSQPSIVGRIFKTGKPELISDTRLDPDYYFGPEMDEAEQRLSMLAVPVMIEGEVVAVIDVEGVETGAFSEEDRKILEILADHVASAMERIQSRRRLEELHEQHNRELVEGVQRVSSMVRHDLRGPLQTIMNAAYVAETNPQRIGEMVEIIMRSVRHQSDIMEDWKNQDLEETLNATEEDLGQLISDSLAASLIPSHITVDVNVDPMNVTLDNVKMRRVMDNLIRNAIEAMEDGGRLTISAREAKDEIVIEVTDTGIGILETEMKNLFKPFYTTKPSGIGLGLTYCKRTVEAHKGIIELESKAGEGTKITISMPKTPEAE
ncbi:MAG: PAS domain S-box protein [Candidatus Bathyarchaeota archaeon]|nr:PAS domain S-box protein [Candidatus Bathyarchaeota archaeon]